MSLTVNAPFLEFYNLCYLMDQSTGCRVGSDHGPGERSHEILTWAQKSLAYITVFPISHPAKNLLVLHFHKLESFCLLLKLAPTSMKLCGCSFSYRYGFAP